MKRLWCILYILIHFTVKAQGLFPLNEAKYVDSLQFRTGSHVDAISKADAYFHLSDYYKNTDSLLSKKYLQSGKQIGTRDRFTMAVYYYYEGLYYQDLNRDKATASFRKAIAQLSELKSQKADTYLSLCWYNYGILQKNKEGYPFLIRTMLEKVSPRLKNTEIPRSSDFYIPNWPLCSLIMRSLKRQVIITRKQFISLKKSTSFYRVVSCLS